MPWRLIYCMFNRHRPNPATVQWSGAFHYGPCRDCGRLVRKSGRGYWKQIDKPVPNAEG
jgi:hypothetical protein